MKKINKITLSLIFTLLLCPSFLMAEPTQINPSSINGNFTVNENENLIRVGNLIFNGNNRTLTINGKLEITGNVSIHANKYRIIIGETGQLIIGGTISVTSQGGGGSRPTLTIDGMVYADKISTNGTIQGSGILVVNEITANKNNFTGNHETNVTFDLPSPSNLNAIPEIGEDVKVKLTWQFNDNEIDEWYKLEGFQVFRKLDSESNFSVIVGSIENKDFIELNNYIDMNGLELGLRPKYFVRAVYSNNYNKSSDYIFSPFSNIQDFSDSPLPIELLDFTAKSGSQGVTITWITAAEINNDYFTVERSTDGYNWEILTYVQGAGNSNTVLTYNYEDMNPLQGISYYRLKQTDFDGQFEYFSPVAVQINSAISKSEIIGANTLGQQIDLVLSTGTQNSQLIIADIQGRIIHTQLLNGNDSVQQISVNLPSSYSGSVVVVRLADNQNSDERKIRVF